MEFADTGPEAVAADSGSAAAPLHIGIAGPIATQDVAHLIDTPQSALPVGYAGAPFLATLIEALLAGGHRVSAFTLSQGLESGHGLVQMAAGPGLQIYYCPMRRRAWQPNGWQPGRIVDLYRQERRALRRAMQQAAPQVLHAHWAYEFAWAAQSTGLPVLVTSHDSPFVVARFYKGFVLGGYRRLRACMAWLVLRRASWVSTVSPYMQQQTAPLCKVPVAVIPNPISPATERAQQGQDARAPRVLMVCNGWGAIKNPEPALRALAWVAEQMPELELILLGQGFGPGEVASRWWADQGLQGRARFVGAVGYPEVVDWMCSSDVLLHPSLEESFGMVLAEAMSTGLAVVAGQESGAAPWVLAGCGRLVDVRSPEAMGTAVLELLRDPQLRASLAAAGQQSAISRFSAAAVAQQYVTLYRRALSGAVEAN